MQERRLSLSFSNIIQDVMQSTVRAWLQDRSLRVTHNLAVFGGVGVVLTIITGLFGINVDGIPGGENTPYAFGVFTAILVFLAVVLVVVGMIYLGLKNPIAEEQVEVRKLELLLLVMLSIVMPIILSYNRDIIIVQGCFNINYFWE